MRGMKRWVAVILAAAGMFGSAVSGFSVAFNPWTTMTGEKTLTIMPMAYGAFNAFTATGDIMLSYGFTPTVDLYVDVANLSLVPDAAYGGSWIMPRVEISPNAIVALKLGYVGGAPLVSPQFHYVFTADAFSVEANVFADFTLGSEITYNIGGYFAPVMKFGSFYAYVDIDPAFDGAAFSLGVMPGIAMDIGANQLSVGVSLGDVLSGTLELGYGVWFWVPIKL